MWSRVYLSSFLDQLLPCYVRCRSRFLGRLFLWWLRVFSLCLWYTNGLWLDGPRCYRPLTLGTWHTSRKVLAFETQRMNFEFFFSLKFTYWRTVFGSTGNTNLEQEHMSCNPSLENGPWCSSGINAFPHYSSVCTIRNFSSLYALLNAVEKLGEWKSWDFLSDFIYKLLAYSKI